MEAIKEIDDKELNLDNSQSAKKNRLRLFLIRATFLLAWILFSLIIFLIAILSDIDWMRPSMEGILSHAVHRNVKLGRLSWRLGIHGFTINATRLLIAERSGEPFLMTGTSEIGFATWPLLIGSLRIQYVDMQKPLFNAIHTSANKWNFDDMLVASPDIDLIQIESGHIFVVDRANPKERSFPDTELNDVQIKLQRAGQFYPAQTSVSFSLADRDSKSAFSVSGNSWGDDNKPWWDKKCQWELTTKRFSIQNWNTINALASINKTSPELENCLRKLSAPLPDLLSIPAPLLNDNHQGIVFPQSGEFDVHATANGIVSKSLVAHIDLKTTNLQVKAPHNVALLIPDSSITAELHATPSSFEWNKVTVRSPDYKLLVNMSGLSTVKTDGRKQLNNLSVIGLLGDLKEMNSLCSFIYQLANNDKKLAGKNLFNNLDGKLFLDLKYNNDSGKNSYTIEAKASEINVEGIKDLLTPITNLTASTVKVNPFENKFCKELSLSNSAQFSGTIIAKSGELLQLKDCSFTDDDMSWKFSGIIDSEGQWQNLTLANKELSLSRLSKKINQSANLCRQVNTFLTLPANNKFSLDGIAQVTVKVSSPNKVKLLSQQNSNCEIIFDDAKLKLSQPAVEWHHLNGSYTCNGKSLICKDLRFPSGNGLVRLDCDMSTSKSEPLSFHLQADNASIADIRSVLAIFHFPTNYLDDWHLTGKVVDFDLTGTGTSANPSFTLNCTPSDITFVCNNLKQSVHANSGKIVYSDKLLSLDKVTFLANNQKSTLSLTIRNPNNDKKLERLSIQLSDTDIGDLQSYLNATGLPALQFAKKYQLSNIKGNLSGNFDYINRSDKPKVNGTFDLNGLSFKSSQLRLSCKNILGKIILQDSDIIFQDLTGNLENSSFTLHGRLLNCLNFVDTKEKIPLWRGEIATQVMPENLSSFVSLVCNGGQKSPFDLQSKKPIFIKLRTHSHPASCHQSFIVIADPDAALTFLYGNTTFYQGKRKLTINGTCVIDDQKISFRSINFDFAGNSINMQGLVNNYHNSKLDPSFDLQVQSADNFPASTFADIFSNPATPTTGNIKANFSIAGLAKNPSITGKISLFDLSFTDLALDHISGNIAFNGNQGSTMTSSLQLDKLTLAPVQLTQANGNLSLQNDFSQFSLKNFTAHLAAGQFSCDGLMDYKAKKIHLNIDLKNADLSQLWPDITNSQVKAAGVFNCSFNIDSTGSKASEIEQNTSGTAHIRAINGSFSRLTQLHAKLGQVNLLRQGLFGFNVNNVMQTVLPSKASEFNSVDSMFTMNQQVINIHHILYDGKDIRFSAAGKVNLALHTLDLDIAGVMPRVSNSVLGGKLGEISREITLQKLLDGVTMHKLDKLPSLPLIGGISGGPEVFTCRIVAPYDQPKMISQSIEKSFHWLHNH